MVISLLHKVGKEMNMQNAGIRIFVSFLDNFSEKVFLVMGILENKLRVGKIFGKLQKSF